MKERALSWLEAIGISLQGSDLYGVNQQRSRAVGEMVLHEWAIANIGAQAREHFFGGDDIEVIDYIADTGNVNSRERRFMSWFTFYFKIA